jgi:hypothetical protein
MSQIFHERRLAIGVREWVILNPGEFQSRETLFVVVNDMVGQVLTG